MTDIGPDEALLGMDMNIHKYLEVLAETQAAQATALVLATRNQTLQEERLQEVDQQSAES